MLPAASVCCLREMTSIPSNDQRKDWQLAIAIMALAWIVRWFYLQGAQAVPMFDALIEDGQSYGEWSDRLAAGDWLGKDIFYQAPLYPYFLGVVKAVLGSDLHTIRLVQISLGALACALLFAAGRVQFGRRAGVAAGLLLALYPSAIFFDACIQKANLGLLWGCALLLTIALLHQRQSVTRWLSLGALLGLMMLTREESILLVPALLLWGLFGLRERNWKHGAALIAGLALVLGPVAWRNHKVGGEWVLTTSQAGSNFYIGNSPVANGTYVPLKPGRSNVAYERRDAIDLAEAESGRKLSPKEVSDFWFAKSWAWIREEPGDWLALMGRKLVLLINAYELPDAEDIYFYERHVPLLRGLNWFLPFGVLASIGIAGLWTTRRRWRGHSGVLIVLAVAAAGVLAFYVFARYRYTMIPGLTLFAGVFLADLLDGELRRQRGRWIALILAAVAVNWPLYSRDFQLPQAYSNAAITLENRGRRAEAVELLRTARDLAPGNAQILGNLGLMLERSSQFAEAEQCYRQAIALRGTNVYDHLRLANLLASRGGSAESLRVLLVAESMASNDAVAWRDAGTIHLQLRDYASARRCQERSLELRPDQTEPRLRLVWILSAAPKAELRDGRRALRLSDELLQAGRKDAGVLEARAAALAELGRFEEAVSVMQQVESSGQAIPAGHAERRAQYQARQPMRLP